MGISSEECRITLENAELILSFLPAFEGRDFEAGKVVVKPGAMPYWNYNDKLMAFVKALYDNHWIIDFDWTPWQPEARKYWSDPELIREADVSTLRKLLTIHVRKDRFCDGHLAQAIKCGQITAILKRIEALKGKGAFVLSDR
ncbi:MAG: DUF6508 domain-containing protein [Candidatus Glassbacteria bacterium]